MVFFGKGEGAARGLMEKAEWHVRKKKKRKASEKTLQTSLKVQKGGSLKPQLKKKWCRTPVRPWEHMFKWVIHEMFHNRNACQTIKCAAVSHLFFSLSCVHRFALVCSDYVLFWFIPWPLTLATERCKCPKNIMAAFLFKNEPVKEDN